MIDQVKGDDDDDCNERVCKEGGQRVSTAAVDSDVCDDGAAPDAAKTDADWFSANTKFHVFTERGD